jgi:hypothetical protein
MAGDASQEARFAFVEFATLDGAKAALALSGTVLGTRAIK